MDCLYYLWFFFLSPLAISQSKKRADYLIELSFIDFILIDSFSSENQLDAASGNVL